MSDDGKISAMSIVKQYPDHIAADIDGDIIVMSVKQGCFFGMSAVGSRIWQMIEAPMRVENIANTLLKEYKVDSDDCHRQTINYLEELLQANLIEIVTSDNVQSSGNQASENY